MLYEVITRETSLREWLGHDTAIVRAMPNTPALVQSGATALYANPAVSESVITSYSIHYTKLYE